MLLKLLLTPKVGQLAAVGAMASSEEVVLASAMETEEVAVPATLVMEAEVDPEGIKVAQGEVRVPTVQERSEQLRLTYVVMAVMASAPTITLVEATGVAAAVSVVTWMGAAG